MRFDRMLAFLCAMAAAPVLAKPPAVVTPAPIPAPAPAADPANILNLDLSTGGRVSILLRPDKAPLSVERIKTLVRRGFYNGLTFHRVIEGFMAQGGDPKGDGSGGSDLPDLKAEFNDMPHVRGEMAMARADSKDSANSQFFLMLSPNLQLDGKYTAVGRVTSGMGYVDLIERGEPPANPSRIIRASMGTDNVPPPAAARAGDAASAAADAASRQAVDAAMASESAARAASAGDKATAAERAKAAQVSAAGAARAAGDAAEALQPPPRKR